MIGHSHILNMRKNYTNIKNLGDTDYKIFSQNGEDGILDYLLYQLNIEKPKFIEIGVGDYSESNTRFIFERTSPRGLIIDCIENNNKPKSNAKNAIAVHQLIESMKVSTLGNNKKVYNIVN